MRLKAMLLAVTMLTAGAPLTDAGGTDTEVSSEAQALSRFFLAIGDYYRIPQTEVVIIRERGIPAYEIPVVLFIAKRAHVAPEIVIDFRLRDNAWLHTTLRFGLGRDIFYVPMGVVVEGSPYGKTYGHYRHKSRKEWKTITLSDDDIINLVNLKLMSEHYGYPPEKIIKMWLGGKEFVSINNEILKEKEKIRENGEK
jgi:hypothetical protein